MNRIREQILWKYRPSFFLSSNFGLVIFCLTSAFCLFSVASDVHAGAFQEKTNQYFGQTLGSTTGVSWADFNNDGFVDMASSGYLWENNGGSSFTSFNGFPFPGTYKPIWADFNNDGNLDCIQTLSATTVRMFYGNGGTSFSEVTLPSLPGSTFYDSASAFDYNGDGFVDLYLAAESTYQDVILLNNGGSSFSISWTQGAPGNFGRGVTSCDFDEDSDMDIYVSNYWQQPNPLWLNNGDGSFSDGTDYGVSGDPSVGAGYGHTIGSCWGDLDNDGYFDLFVGNFNHHDSRISEDSKFYRNLGPPSYHFEDKSATAGFVWQESFAHPTLGDYDNDGDLDLFITIVYPIASGGIPNYAKLYRNNGNWTFTDVSDIEGLGGLDIESYQAAWADIDNDGDLDLLTCGKLFVNQGNANHWLRVQMAGDAQSVNSAAIGAQVRIDVNGKTLTRQVEAGTGQGNQNDLTLHFGLGSHSSPVDLEVLWPNGDVQMVSDVAVDQKITVTQSASSLFYDRFYNLNKWTHISSSNPATIESGLASGHEPYMHVYYGTMRADLPEPVTSVFKVKFKWLMDDWANDGYIWLMNSTGTEGYGVRWNAGSDSDGYRGGHINIMKYNSVNEYDCFREYTEPGSFTQLIPGASYLSGDSTKAPFANYEFTWDQTTGELKVKVGDWVHGIHKISVIDTDFSSFSRIYTNAASGGEFYIDELRVNPDESELTCQDLIDDGYRVPSDFNNNCYVNLEDLAVFVADWIRCNDPANEACEETW